MYVRIVIVNIRDSALSLVVSQMADSTQFWSAIFMFCSENGRWQAAISSSETVLQFYWHRHSCMLWYMQLIFIFSTGIVLPSIDSFANLKIDL